jgi:PLP dependent protein
MSIQSEIQRLKEELPASTKLLAVSKFHPVESIQEAYSAGQRMFGESRAQELCEKAPLLPNDIEWHFIGHLQSNKIRQILPFVSLIHGIDSIRLLLEINKEGERIRRAVPCLLQIFVAQEETKFGFTPDECRNVFASEVLNDLPFVRIRGLMGMASLTDNKAQILMEFGLLKKLFDEIKNKRFLDNPTFSELSMGMSDDYVLAVNEGSTMVRIGSKIFGQREY